MFRLVWLTFLLQLTTVSDIQAVASPSGPSFNALDDLRWKQILKNRQLMTLPPQFHFEQIEETQNRLEEFNKMENHLKEFEAIPIREFKFDRTMVTFPSTTYSYRPYRFWIPIKLIVLGFVGLIALFCTLVKFCCAALCKNCKEDRGSADVRGSDKNVNYSLV